jgi:selenocysteine lyase/cysteine desulfurase
VGHFYAYRLVKTLHIDTGDGLLRASFVHYTSVDEINRLVAALRTIV